MDLASKDWIIIATGRADKPSDFKGLGKGKKPKKCPLCSIEDQKTPVLVMVNGKAVLGQKEIPKNWTLAVVPNKYPVLMPYFKLEQRKEGGLYKKMNAVGFHEVIIPRNHNKQVWDLPVGKVKEIIDAYQTRYLGIKDKEFVKHISIFQNHGQDAGASLIHPHFQIITTVLLDVDLENTLLRAKKYYRKNKTCLYCDMKKHELKVKKRIVFKNNNFVALCPYASKSPFQVIITPQKHLPYFEKITEKEKWDLAQAFKNVLRKIKKGLKSPSYNFYLHTAPADGKKHDYYHWHFTVMPKVKDSAGFEIGTRMEIITISPEQAAAYLRKQ